MNDYKAIIDKAFFGNVESREKLMRIADEMFASGAFQDAATMYREGFTTLVAQRFPEKPIGMRVSRELDWPHYE